MAKQVGWYFTESEMTHYNKNTFKIGDKVVAHQKTIGGASVDTFEHFKQFVKGQFVKGKYLTVFKFEEDGTIRCKEGFNSWYFFPQDLTLYVEKSSDKFKKGDKVLVDNTCNNGWYYNGKSGVVSDRLPEELCPDGGTMADVMYIVNFTDTVGVISEDVMKLIEDDYFIGGHKVTTDKGVVKVGCYVATNAKLKVIKELMGKGVEMSINGKPITKSDLEYLKKKLT